MNYDKYIGLPYLDNGRTEAGVDCWGLARLVYSKEYGIELPSYSDEYIGGTDPYIVEAVNLYKDNWQEINTPNIGDLCLFNIFGEPMHVGIYIGENKFLHCRIGSDSVIESLNNIKWKNRFQGFYTYAPQAQVQAIGTPHPLKLRAHRDWTAAGTTIQDFVDFVKIKYTTGTQLVGKIVVMLDGVVIPKTDWETTRVKAGQELSYKTIAQGSNTTRLLILIAAFVITGYVDPTTGLTGAQTVGTMVGATTNAQLVGSLVISSSAMILSNVIAPIRPPKTNDPGSALGLNLLNGQANQASQYGAIPVVLGKVRFTGMLGAVPYVESLTETNILNTAIVWGFGPLSITDLCIGSKPIEDFYYGEPVSVPRPVTIQGFARDYVLGAAGGDGGSFNNLYGRDVEPRSVNLELTNNASNITATHPGTKKWQQVDLVQNADAVDVVLSFPEGMRKINIKNGEIGTTTCGIEIQMRTYSTSEWPEEDTSSGLNIYSFKPGFNVFQTFTMTPPGDSGLEVQLYRYTTFCISPNGGLQRFDGAVTDILGANASDSVQAMYEQTAYSYLVGTSGVKSYQPQIPPGYLPIYTVYQQLNGYVTEITPHPIAAYSGVSGLTYSLIETQETWGDYNTSAIKTIKITSGRVYGDASGLDLTAAEQVIWSTNNLLTPTVATGVAAASRANFVSNGQTTNGVWGTFNASNGTYYTTPAASGYGGTWNYTVSSVNFPYDGYYTVEAAADDQGEILIDGVRAVQIPKLGGSSIESIKGLIKLKKGPHTIVLNGVDNQASQFGIAAKITYIANNGVNLQASPNTILTFGEGAWFTKRKDAFNWVHSVENLPRARYQVRVRRTNTDETEDEVDYKKFHKAILANVTAYDSLKLPMVNPPGCFLAKTGVRVQSSSKVNGQIDGVNAMVQTITWDYDRTTSSWQNLRETNNPASLFIYVLMHPANAFRVTTNKLDLTSLTAWHNYCNPIPQTVNATSLQTGKYYVIKELGTTNWNTVVGTSGIVYNVGDGIYPVTVGTGTGTATYDPKFTYNSVLSNTQSVMDTLRDICAAGKASPTYIDGKWGVIIDTERTHTVQHFTEHNSWGFESTKVLPVLPHAFRINLNDETMAYQANEIIVYNYDYGPTTANGKIGATLFEQINLPGVTNPDQATRLARWHFAQIKLRPETYTINVDFEHLVCTRGDKVKITHSVPQWGIGSGRLGPGVDDVVSGTTLTLREPVPLINNTAYTILIRTNNITTTPGSGSVTRNFTYTGSTGYTTTITVPNISSGDGVRTDNLFMIGLSTNTTQECIVISVEPSSNYSARLTLVDYSPEIYTQDLSGLLIYNPKISTSNVTVVVNSITSAPIITSITSDSIQSNQISNGNYQNKATVAFTNPNDLQAIASRVQFDIIEGDVAGWDSDPSTLYSSDKNNSNFEFTNLFSNKMYKVRVRYTNSDRTICGPWSIDYAFTNTGKTVNNTAPPVLTLDLDHTFIVAKPTVTEKTSDFFTYEYRLYKNTGTTDFWELDTTANNIKIIQNTGDARFDLREQPTPRLSSAGVTYRVACRALDKQGNYSTTSTLKTIVIKTIT